MRTLDYLGLEEKRVDNIVSSLGQLLADFQVFYSNLRGFHWNVRGKGFFILHSKYEELYDDAAEKIDEIAERILQLGGKPENRYSEYLKISNVKEDGFNVAGREGLQSVLDTIGLLIKQERDIISIATEAGDDVTVALLGDYLKGQEKLVWMLLSFLENRHEHCNK